MTTGSTLSPTGSAGAATAAAAPAVVEELVPGQEVLVRGRLDVRSVAEVRDALHRVLLSGRGDLLIHLAEAEVHDSSGLAVVVSVHRRAVALERRLVVVDATPRLERLVRGSRLHRVLNWQAPREDLLAGRRRQGRPVVTVTP
ncbi:STAS domain-containing protein [Arsenicicoccus piscis]|uniref:STAS domain-containing protein n=1 Tax=Arsenicicoccus piscis TaxID=673954 RepID=A0ABQ6HRS5_9MICO|nr:STAS domain-containing protein [Arsenicicoccus piscis]MCH8629170.1 STAS domain-containing protein [Arsenicicoccus piscis]GMA20265.1 hypothetical protein GCM10025862_22860 [Arsenicicoccus piscis]